MQRNWRKPAEALEADHPVKAAELLLRFADELIEVDNAESARTLLRARAPYARAGALTRFDECLASVRERHRTNHMFLNALTRHDL